MGEKYIPWILFLHLLLITCSYGRQLGGTAQSKNLEISEDHHTAHAEHHMDHIKDKTATVFFTWKDLKVGKIMPNMHFPKKSLSNSPQFWPREEADLLPFSSEQLPNLLKHFSFYPDSREGKAMKDTITTCENKPLKGEVKTCATSLESMLDFVQSFIGPNLQVYSTSFLTEPRVISQNYTFLENIVKVPSPRMAACHAKDYPYAIFLCHSFAGVNELYKIPLVGDNGDRVDGMAVCHMDTSLWWEGHVSFQALKVKPGTPLCHFVPFGDLFFVPQY